MTASAPVYAGRTFDRRPQFDPRSMGYPVRRLINVRREPRSYTWGCPVSLDQGQEGACVGFAFAHELAARPVSVPNVDDKLARALYRGAQTNDEWPGEDYEGTSVLGGAKFMTRSGDPAVPVVENQRLWYKSYAWGQSALDLRDYVVWHGPAVLGINWYEGMITPGAGGYIYPDGEVVGGHGILCHGYNINRNAFRLHNSWGTTWGERGGAWLKMEHMTRLLLEDGECCMPLRLPYLKAVEKAVYKIARRSD